MSAQVLPKRPSAALPSSAPFVPFDDDSKILIMDIKTEHGQAKKDRFIWGPFLGKGAYAACHEVTHESTGKVFACKIFPREKLASESAKSRFLAEVSIHRSIVHKHIVQFHSVGSNRGFYFLLLEKCNNKSLRQVIRARHILPELEVRYWMSQLLDALNFLHENNICHRDLKLDNIFLNEMQVKLGDFGFSVKLLPNETSKTFCGTPNYIAPEVLARTGYSMPIDIWAVGVLLYTMLFGTPPFETASAETTYAKIQANDYSFPEQSDVSEDAKDLIRSCLQHRPQDRPNCRQILSHNFFSKHSIPTTLSLSSLGYSRQSLDRLSQKPLISNTHGQTKTLNPTLPQSPKHQQISSKTLLAKENNINSAILSAKQASNTTQSPRRALATLQNETRIDSGSASLKKRKRVSVEPFPGYDEPAPKRIATLEGPAPAQTVSSTSSHNGTKSLSSVTVSANSHADKIEEARNIDQQPSSIPLVSDNIKTQKWDDHRHLSSLIRIDRRITEIAASMSKVEPNRCTRVTRSQSHQSSPTAEFETIRPQEAHALGHHWIVKWVDYSQRFGLGFQFCDSSLGVLFNDGTSLISKPNDSNFVYSKFVDHPSSTGSSRYWVVESFNKDTQHDIIQSRPRVKNRMNLLDHFSDYMCMKLTVSSGFGMGCETPKPTKENFLGVLRWVKTSTAIGFLFTDLTIQINFFDHTKLVITLPDLTENPDAKEIITVVSDSGVGTTLTVPQILKDPSAFPKLIDQLKFAHRLIRDSFSVN